MEDMHFDPVDAPPVRVILAAATDFGLTGAEIRRAAGDAAKFCDGDPDRAAYREELVAVLAFRIIAKHRRRISAQRGFRLADEVPASQAPRGAR